MPLSLGALVTGVVQALGTHWGVRKYYWVLVKLLFTIFATIALLLHQYTAVRQAARRVSGDTADLVPSADLDRLGTQLVADAALATLLLLVVTILSVYKPWGRTRYGRRCQAQTWRQRRGHRRVADRQAI